VAAIKFMPYRHSRHFKADSLDFLYRWDLVSAIKRLFLGPVVANCDVEGAAQRIATVPKARAAKPKHRRQNTIVSVFSGLIRVNISPPKSLEG